MLLYKNAHYHCFIQIEKDTQNWGVRAPLPTSCPSKPPLKKKQHTGSISLYTKSLLVTTHY